MDRRDISDLLILQAIVEAGSFTRAATHMGRAQSGLSQTVSAFEERLGVALLARSTRGIRPTDAGQKLLEQIGPALRHIENSLATTGQKGQQPSGILRLTTMEYPARAILIPVLTDFLAKYPNIHVDIDVSDRFVDIVKEGFDAGIRFGSQLEKDMVAVSISPDVKAVVVAAPTYYARHGQPGQPQDLADHHCLNYRTASHGDKFRWLFQKKAKAIEIPVKGAATLNDASVMIEAAKAGLGLAYAFEPHVAEHLVNGTLVACLQPFCPAWPGYHIYYPGRRQKSAALTALVQFLRDHHPPLT